MSAYAKLQAIMKCDLCNTNPIQVIYKLKEAKTPYTHPLLDELRICISCYNKILAIDEEG